MSDINVKVKNECIKRIDNYIKELTELKKMLNDGIETKEKVNNVLQRVINIRWNHNNIEQIRSILDDYHNVLKMIDN